MSVDINIRENKYNLNLNDLIVMGKRINNKKRNFLSSQTINWEKALSRYYFV